MKSLLNVQPWKQYTEKSTQRKVIFFIKHQKQFIFSHNADIGLYYTQTEIANFSLDLWKTQNQTDTNWHEDGYGGRAARWNYNSFPDMNGNESEVTPANHNWDPDSNEERRCLTKTEWFVVRGWQRVTPVCTWPCCIYRQMRSIFLFKEGRAWCCMAVDPRQMDRHMAWALSFRCSACCVALNKARVHKFKRFTGAIWKCVSSVTVWFGIWTCVCSTLHNVFPTECVGKLTLFYSLDKRVCYLQSLTTPPPVNSIYFLNCKAKYKFRGNVISYVGRALFWYCEK